MYFSSGFMYFVKLHSEVEMDAGQWYNGHFTEGPTIAGELLTHLVT